MTTYDVAIHLWVNADSREELDSYLAVHLRGMPHDEITIVERQPKPGIYPEDDDLWEARRP